MREDVNHLGGEGCVRVRMWGLPRVLRLRTSVHGALERPASWRLHSHPSLLACPATGLHQPLIACRRRRGHIKDEGSPAAGWQDSGQRNFWERLPKRSFGGPGKRDCKKARRAGKEEKLTEGDERRGHGLCACTSASSFTERKQPCPGCCLCTCRRR